jgi:hypothetical protein
MSPAYSYQSSEELDVKGGMIMKGKYLLRGIRNLLLGATLVFGVTALASTNTKAQARFHGGGFHTRVFVGPGFGPYRYWYGYPYGYPYYGYDGRYVFGDNVGADSRGYEDGLKTGEADARHGRSYDPERSHYFRNAGFGNFASAYREGFERGYNAGFRS